MSHTKEVGGAKPSRRFGLLRIRVGDTMLVMARAVRVLEDTAVSLLMVVISTVTLTQVIFRFILKMPLAWSDELATFCFVWLALLGSVVGVREKAHIGVDAFIRLFPSRFRAAITLGSVFLLLLFFSSLFKFGVELLGRVEDQRSAAMGIQIFWVYISMPVSMALMFLHTLPETFRAISGVWPNRLANSSE